MTLLARQIAKFALAAAIAAVAPAVTANAASDGLVRLAQSQPLELGRLDCMVVPGSRRNLLISSTALVDCVFNAASGPVTYYRGETGIGLGIDLSIKTDDRFSFAVLTARPAPDYTNHPLAGRYYGAEATVSIGRGIGAKALVGGSGQQFTLAPIGGQTTIGEGISAGAGYLYLEPAR